MPEKKAPFAIKLFVQPLPFSEMELDQWEEMDTLANVAPQVLARSVGAKRIEFDLDSTFILQDFDREKLPDLVKLAEKSRLKVSFLYNCSLVKKL